MGTQLRADYDREGFCRPTSCPVCGDRVYFVRHNGGSVWFDDLGWPWPRHGCFDGSRTEHRVDAARSLGNALREAATNRSDGILGVVTASDTVTSVEGRSYLLLGADAQMRQLRISTDYSQSTITGRFALLFERSSTLTLIDPVSRVRVNRVERIAGDSDRPGELASASHEGGEASPPDVHSRPSEALAAVVGAQPLPRVEVMYRLWDYIRANDLLESNGQRRIRADEKLRRLFGSESVSVFDVLSLVSQHLEE